MPWDAASFKSRHNHKLTPAQARKAARIATGMVNAGEPEGLAIATGNARAEGHAPQHHAKPFGSFSPGGYSPAPAQAGEPNADSMAWSSHPLNPAEETERQRLSRPVMPPPAGVGLAHDAQKYGPGGSSMMVQDLLRALADEKARKRLDMLNRRSPPF